MVTYDVAQRLYDLQKILDLQQRNLLESLAEGEMETEGFVTVKHDLDILNRMNEPYRHVIAREDEEVVGYALVMLREFEQQIPVLVPMFEQINAIEYEGKRLGESTYFVMGQICIAKGYRGKGLFKGLYEKMRAEMSAEFSYIITEVAKKNRRSTKAHLKTGFKIIYEYQPAFDQEEWIIVLWDWK